MQGLIKQGLIKRNPWEIKFHQATAGLTGNIITFMNENLKHIEKQINMRMTKPGWKMIFRVYS